MSEIERLVVELRAAFATARACEQAEAQHRQAVDSARVASRRAWDAVFTLQQRLMAAEPAVGAMPSLSVLPPSPEAQETRAAGEELA